MYRQNVIAAGLLVLVSVLVVAAGYAKGWRPLDVLNSGITRLTSSSSQPSHRTAYCQKRSLPLLLNSRRAHG